MSSWPGKAREGAEPQKRTRNVELRTAKSLYMGRELTLDNIISVHNMTPECGMVGGKITKILGDWSVRFMSAEIPVSVQTICISCSGGRSHASIIQYNVSVMISLSFGLASGLSLRYGLKDVKGTGVIASTRGPICDKRR
jgi:hypothetical protein